MRALFLSVFVTLYSCAPLAAQRTSSTSSGHDNDESRSRNVESREQESMAMSVDVEQALPVEQLGTSDPPLDCANVNSPRHLDRDSDGLGDACDTDESYSRFEIRGEQKSSVTRGYWRSYSPRESKFDVQFTSEKRNKLAFSVESPEGAWNLVLGAPEELKVGTYKLDDSLSPSAPELSLSSQGRGINQVEGWFRIDELHVTKDGSIENVQGQYEFRPSRLVYREFGRFQFNSSKPLSPWGADLSKSNAPSESEFVHQLRVSVVQRGKHTDRLKKDLLITSKTHQFLAQGGGSRAEVRVRGQDNYSLDLMAPVGRRLVPGVYLSETRRGSNLLARFDVGGPNEIFSSCRDPKEVRVNDVLTDPTGRLTGLSASTELECANDIVVIFRLDYGTKALRSDLDFDEDGVPDVADNCVTVSNKDQADADNDGKGDSCDDTFDNVWLSLESDEGDIVGEGEKARIYLRDARIAALVLREDQSAVGVLVALGDELYSYDFQMASGKLRPGKFRGATRFPFNRNGNAPGKPGLNARWHGRGCNELLGEFTVHEIVFSQMDRVERFSADFEQHCEDAQPALRGKIRYNSTLKD